MDNIIKDNVLFIVEEENCSWQYYHYYYIVTTKGNIYKCEGDNTFKISGTSKFKIDEFVQSIDEKKIYIHTQADAEVLKEMALKSQNIKQYSKGYTKGIAFDAGDIRYYAFNENVTEFPIIVGIRGDMDVHSENHYEEDIAIWLDKVIEDIKDINKEEFFQHHKK
ncbi:TPA: hypothetical protein N2D99_002219 [Clostridium botulinum]|nr:hypothetical protein [Clostridium botulinum]